MAWGAARVLFLVLAAGPVFVAGAELRVPEAEAKKAAIAKPAPEYPMVARQLKVSGKVEVEASVSDSGAVEDVHVVSGNPLLTKPVAEAVRKWRFKPFLADGKPAPAIVSLSFEFGSR